MDFADIVLDVDGVILDCDGAFCHIVSEVSGRKAAMVEQEVKSSNIMLAME